MYDAMLMDNVYHVDNVFWERNKRGKKNIKNNRKVCPSGAYTGWGP